ncbi:MAG: Holliday junction branch migration protein RuvA [Chloroflexi bacterium]|nr:Holliday junction branch migration protein RuvA [Chloroflexota bacterium]
MIAAVQGVVEALGPGYVIVKVGGVSLKVHVPASAVDVLGRVGREVQLHTHLYLREDNVALYGFATSEELGLFERLIAVSGVGPKVALASLSALGAERLAGAIAAGQVELLSQVPGVGRKLAGRLVLELKGRLEMGALPFVEQPEVVAALTSLGYSSAEAMAAAASLPNDPEMGLEERIKEALAYFAGKGK